MGILFDGNIESLPWNFFYDDTVGRTVLTDSRGIIEALQAELTALRADLQTAHRDRNRAVDELSALKASNFLLPKPRHCCTIFMT